MRGTSETTLYIVNRTLRKTLRERVRLGRRPGNVRLPYHNYVSSKWEVGSADANGLVRAFGRRSVCRVADEIRRDW